MSSYITASSSRKVSLFPSIYSWKLMLSIFCRKISIFSALFQNTIQGYQRSSAPGNFSIAPALHGPVLALYHSEQLPALRVKSDNTLSGSFGEKVIALALRHFLERRSSEKISGTPALWATHWMGPLNSGQIFSERQVFILIPIKWTSI